MRAPGLPGSQFPGDDAQARKIRDLERMLQQLKAGQAMVADEAFATAIANPDSLTRVELEKHFLEDQGDVVVIDGGTP